MVLQEVRKRKGYTQSGLGVLVGVSQQQIAKYEAGLSSPSKKVIYKIAEVLDLTPYETWEMFFGEKDSPAENKGGECL